VDALQFQKAEFHSDGGQCDACKAPLPNQYFKLYSGQENVAGSLTICAACAAKIQAEQAAPSHPAFLRGILYGTGAAIACCIGYAAVIMISGLEIGLVAILVGYLVGQAVRKGSAGRGGRRCQIAAVALTYIAITFSYVPVALQQMSKQSAPKAEAKQPGPATPATPPLSAGNFVLAVVILGGVALASPILSLQEGFSGILGILILGFGLQRAWVLTGRDQRQVTGPFEREGTVAVV